MTRAFCTSTTTCASAALAYDLSREELYSLVDNYPEQDEGVRSPPTSKLVKVDGKPAGENQAVEAATDIATRNTVAQLVRLLDSPQSPLEHIMEVYHDIPPPGAQHLSRNIIRKMRNRLADGADRDRVFENQYLDLIEDCRTAGKAIPTSAWTTVISLTGRANKRVTSKDVDSILSRWKQMETEAGTPANEVTFNVMFDVTSKARKFVLADMIYQEMQARGHHKDRFFRVSLIYYYGLKKDGAGVRRAYKELVDAGEMVDTVVVSCVVEALLQAGEPLAADHTFERAKQLHARKSGTPSQQILPPTARPQSNYLGPVLVTGTSRSWNKPSPYQETANATDLAPTIRTYRALIYYHAMAAGDIERVAALVAELEAVQLPISGIIFHHIFKGFATHGGLRYSSWTQHRLEGAFEAYLNAIASSNGQVFVSEAMCELCLGAFVRVAGVERMREVWDELQLFWTKAREEDIARVAQIVEGLAQRFEMGMLAQEQGFGRTARKRHFYLR